MNWEDILKDFKSSKGVSKLSNAIDRTTSNNELKEFLNYRLNRIKKSIDIIEGKEDKSPSMKEYEKRLKNEYEKIMRFMPNYIKMLKELLDLEQTIEETVRAENKLDQEMIK